MSVQVTGLIAALLLISLLNLGLAALLLLNREPGKRAILTAAGPLGIALFTLAWAIATLTPAVLPRLQVIAGYAALLSILGVALDVLGRLPLRLRLRLGVGLAAAVVAAVGGVYLLSRMTDGIELRLYGPRACCAPLLLAVVVGAALLRRGATNDARLLATRVLVASATAAPIYLVVCALSFVVDDEAFVDPAIAALLAAEGLALVHAAEARARRPATVSRIVSHGALGVAVAFASGEGFHRLGFSMTAAQLTLLVALVLFGAVILLTTGDALQRRVERVLFPAQAALRDHLNASRAESATLRRRLGDVERKALIGELAARVAHEVKNPLAAVRGYAQLMGATLSSLPPDARESFEKGLRIIREESDRIDARVRELLTLGQERSRTHPLERFEANRLVLEAVAAAEGDAGEVRLHVQLDSAAGEVSGQPDELRGALLNLIRNAVEATAGAKRSEVRIRSHCDGDSVVVEVVDDGLGIAAETLPRLFTPFFTTRPQGTGLGLCIARTAVEASGGTLTLTPRTDQRGAIARMSLPRAVGRPAIVPAAETA